MNRKLLLKILYWPTVERYSLLEVILFIYILTVVRNPVYQLLALIVGCFIIALVNMSEKVRVLSFLHAVRRYNDYLHRSRGWDKSQVARRAKPPHNGV